MEIAWGKKGQKSMCRSKSSLQPEIAKYLHLIMA